MPTRVGYGVVSVTAAGEPADENTASRRSLTVELGCREMGVDAYHLAGGDTVDLDPGRERIVLAPRGSGPIELDGRFAIQPAGLARLPPSRPCTIGAAHPATVLVVSAGTAAVDSTEPTILDLDAVDYVVPSTSAVPTAHLTPRLGCTGLKVNARTLEPGQAVPHHTEGTQEELFVPLSESATMRLGEERVETPAGSVVRVAPETPRSACNDGETPGRWVMFGAPPTGDSTGWDPGARIVE